MDPTTEELENIASFDDAMDWSGVEGVLRTQLAAVMGGLRKVREVALITRTSWDNAVASLRIPLPPDPAAPDVERNRPLQPVEEARIESLRRVCFLRIGKEPDLPGQTGPTAPQAGTMPFPTPGGTNASSSGIPATSPTKKLRLSAILDPTLEADIIPLSTAELGDMYTSYRERFGDFPSPECDPTSDQVAAVKQVLASGSPPFACFTTFGPHGQRLLRRQTFTGWQLNVATGEWAKREQPGPSNFHAWYKCWRVYRTVMLLLEACPAERLDNYAEAIRGYVTQYGDETWFLISKAETLMRSEHLDRLRRQLRNNPEFGFTEASPWGACYALAIKDHEFWTRELHTPATLWLARNKREMPTKEEPGQSSAPPKRQKQNRPPRRGYEGEDNSVKDEAGLYIINRRGTNICRNWNAGKCGNSNAAQSKCKNGRSHQCHICLGPHQATSCKKGGGTNPKDS